MKKMLTLLTIGLSMVFAVHAKTFDDKTNTDQLTYRTLDAGQISWNEEDGAAIIYIGSPSESKNLRAIDPTAIRGYRYKTITSELTFNGSSNTVMMTNGVYKYTCGADTSPTLYDYIQITSKHTVTTNKLGVIETEYYRYNDQNQTYERVYFPVGYEIDPAVETIYYRLYYKLARFQIFSKDSIIEDLDYVYTEIKGGGLGDFPEIKTIRTITYDGRKATLDVRVTAGRSQDWFQVSSFTARCKGIGDQEIVNDVSNESDLTVMIKDNEGTYNLANLRTELYHKYDGNRGEHWANYPAINNLKLNTKFITFNNTNINMNSTIGASGRAFMFGHGGMNYLKYTPPSELDPSSPWYGLECQITALNRPATGSYSWSIDMVLNKAVQTNFIDLEYKSDLLEPFWNPIDCTKTDVNGDQMTWHIVIPEAYGIVDKGFWRIKLTVNSLEGTMDVKATLRLLGSDGHMYKLTFPVGGGAVTATLDD